MINFVGFLIAVSHIGTVDRVENNLAHVVFAFEELGNIATDIPVELLPCEVSEGDRLFVRKTNGTTEIRCTESPPVDPASLEVRIDGATGEVQYIIKDIPIELE